MLSTIRTAAVLAWAMALPPALAAQEPAPPTAVPTFHAGQWGALFSMGSGFTGLGAMRFSSATAAWTLSVSGAVSRLSTGGFRGTQYNVVLAPGRRIYHRGVERVRAFHGYGLNLSYNTQTARPPSQEVRTYGVGGYGELGAQIFLTRDLSVGTSWRAIATNYWARSYMSDALVGTSTNWTVSFGQFGITGAFYF